MSLNNFIINNGSSEKSYLNYAYRSLLMSTITTLDDKTFERWETYHSIIDELSKQGYEKEYKEIKYRLTDDATDENPNDVFIDVLSRIELSPLLVFLQRRIEMYIDDELISRFL
tara:strand:+ start:8127 stop:8468 length:342 start_codon:yes stop_codon:yes gene_type:complete